MLRFFVIVPLLTIPLPALAASCGKAANMERVLADKYGREKSTLTVEVTKPDRNFQLKLD